MTKSSTNTAAVAAGATVSIALVAWGIWWTSRQLQQYDHDVQLFNKKKALKEYREEAKKAQLLREQNLLSNPEVKEQQASLKARFKVLSIPSGTTFYHVAAQPAGGRLPTSEEIIDTVNEFMMEDPNSSASSDNKQIIRAAHTIGDKRYEFMTTRRISLMQVKLTDNKSVPFEVLLDRHLFPDNGKNAKAGSQYSVDEIELLVNRVENKLWSLGFDGWHAYSDDQVERVHMIKRENADKHYQHPYIARGI